MLQLFSNTESDKTDRADFTIINNFCQNNNEQFNNGIDIILNADTIFPLITGQVLLHNIPKPGNTFSLYDNSIILQNEKGLRFHYFFKGRLQITAKNNDINQGQQELMAEIKNKPCKLKLVIEDNKNRILYNPIQHLPSIDDRVKPTIIDFMIKQGDKFVSLKPYWKIQKIDKGGTLYIKCYDRIIKNGNNLAPFKIELFIKGVLKKVIKFKV